MQCKAVFELFQKLHLQIYASQLMTSKLFQFQLSFSIWKLWRGKEKMTLSQEQKELFR